MNRVHDVVQLLVNFLLAPAQTHRVLSHLKTRSSYATCVDSLARSEELTCSNELLDSFSCTSHVRNLGYALRLVCEDGLGIIAVKLVLCSTCQVYVGLNFPRLLSCYEFRSGEFVLVRLAYVVARRAEFEHVVNLIALDACLVEDVAVGTRQCDDLSAKLGGLLCSTPCYVAETRNSNGLALKAESASSHHLIDEVESTVTGSFRTDA